MSRLRKASVAVLSWNGRRHLEACLPAVLGQEDPGVEWEVLLLDNGSSDGTADWVRAAYPQVRLLESPWNLGFCEGNTRLAREAAGDAIAFLNNDTRPAPMWLRALVEALAGAPTDVAAVSGQILDWNGERLDFAEGQMTFDGHAFQLDYHRPVEQVRIPPTGTELLFPCGGNMLIRRQAFIDAGGFDRDYFAYLEDVDLGWRLWAMGHRVTLAPEARVYHRSMATSELLGLYNRGFLFERNAFLTAYKNYEAGLWEKVMPAVMLTLISRTQTLLVENNPGGSLLALDPYRGLIANTGPESGSERPGGTLAQLSRKWRQYGTAEFVRRGWERTRRTVAAAIGGTGFGHQLPILTDERTQAQFRALGFLLGHLDAAAAKRQDIQERRRRSDREIFERFPPLLVPTYPGDEELFQSRGFREWLPAELPVVFRRLEDLMCLDE